MAQIILKCTQKQPVVWKCAHNETSSAHTNIRTNTAIPEEFMLEGIFQRKWNWSKLRGFGIIATLWKCFLNQTLPAPEVEQTASKI
jgi:hypothetical protein